MKAQYDKAAVDAPFEVGQHVWVFIPKPRKGLSKKLRHMWSGPFRICAQLSPVHYQLRTCDNRLVATVVHTNHMKPFYDPADRPILPPIDDDPNEPTLLESDLPDASFEQPSHPVAEAISPGGALDATPNNVTDDSSPPDDDNEDNSETDVLDSEVVAPPNNVAVDSLDLNQDSDVYTVKKIVKKRQRNGKVQYLVKWAGFPASQSTWEPEEHILDVHLFLIIRTLFFSTVTLNFCMCILICAHHLWDAILPSITLATGHRLHFYKHCSFNYVRYRKARSDYFQLMATPP